MKKMLKNIISLLLCAVMIFGAAPLDGFKDIHLPKGVFSNAIEKVSSWLDNLKLSSSASALDETSGQCGANAKWVFNNGKLTIFGEGGIYNNYTGWNNIKGAVQSVEIQDGITSLGTASFSNFGIMKNITVPESVTSIGNAAFSRCVGLTSINIPDGVESIGGGAFTGCTGLTNITIPDKVKIIGSGAFYNCIGLTSINIPDGVTNIGSSAFYNCTGLANVSIPESVSYIGVQAFLHVLNINYSSDWYKTVMKERGSPWGALAVNNYAEGYLIYEDSSKEKIVRCSPYANGEIVIPGSVKTITDKTFYECTGLTSVTLSDSVIVIGNSAFYGCTGLTSVMFSDSVKKVGDSAFYGCTGLTSVTLDSVMIIGNSAFYGCTGLTSMTLDNVKTIGTSAFFGCTGLTSISIPKDVTTIGASAFSGCTGLTSITIPNKVTKIGDLMFSGCTGLTSITIPDSVTTIGDKAFYGCTGLTSVELQNSVTSIGNSAFYNCTGLTSINIPDSVKDIGSQAFYCVNNVTYTANMTATGSPWDAKVANGFIDDCLIYENDSKQKVCGFSSELSGEITIPGSVTSIGKRAFWNCKGLVSISIPNSVTSIDNFAFAHCKELTSINFSDKSGLTSIGNSVFFGCTELTNITIPNSVISIGNLVFSGCTGLTSINFSDKSGLTSIGNSAFSSCTSLTSITIPNKVTSINGGTFSNCTGLTNISIPDSVINIEAGAFSRCTGLTSISIPDSVTDIKGAAFYGCTGLTSIFVPDTVKNIGRLAFNDVNNVAYKENMKATGSPWGAKIANGYVDESSNLVYTDNSMTELVGCSTAATGEITIPLSVETIRDNAFYGCNGIEKITIPTKSNISSIGDKSFYGVINLVYPKSWYKDNMKEIGSPWGAKAVDAYIEEGLFYYDSTKELLLGCSPKVSGPITIPDSVEEVGENCFYGCENITLLEFTSPVYFADSAVAGCENIKIKAPFNSDDFGVIYTKPVIDRVVSTNAVVPGSKILIKDNTGILHCNIDNDGKTYNYTVSDKIISISENAFANCTNVTVAIPDTVNLKHIGANAFLNSGNFKAWNGEGVLSIGDSKNDYYIVDAKDTFSSYTLPSTIKGIADKAFFGCKSLKKFSCDSSSSVLSFIGSKAFSGCGDSLKSSFTIPSSLVHIGSDLFDTENQNGKRETVTINGVLFSVSENVESYTILDDTTVIADGAFEGCSKLKSIKIPISVTTIGDNAFSGCVSLESVSIGENMKEIGANAFRECISLEQIKIPASVDEIGALAFYGCSSLKEFTVVEGNANYKSVSGVLMSKDGKTLIQYPISKSYTNEYKIESGTFISDLAFYRCRNISTISFGDRIKFGNRNPLASCSARYILNGVEKDLLFRDDTEIVLISVSQRLNKSGELTLPSTLNEIGSYALSGFNNVTKIVIPNNVTKIGDFAFEECKNLKTVTLSPELVNIGDSAFYGCVSLTRVTIPKSVETIGNCAFENCSNLKEVEFSKNDDSDYNKILVYIGEFAFCNCPCNAKGGSYNKKVLDEDITTIGKYAFHNHNEDEWNQENVVREPTLTGVGTLKRHCSECNKTKFETLPSIVSFAEGISIEGDIIFGFPDLPLDTNVFLNKNYDGVVLSVSKKEIGTGTVMTFSKDGKNIGDLTVVLFGDVNGDGWYDGTDAVLVSMIAGGMLTKEQVGEAVYMAADCNHDGTIDEFDEEILQKAGLLLANVDQSKSSEELQTDSNYIEYLSLIDQNPTVDEPADEPTSETNFFQMFINFIVKIFNYLKLHFAILK